MPHGHLAPGSKERTIRPLPNGAAPSPIPRPRRSLAAALVAVLLTLGALAVAPSPAVAADPVDLGASPLLDAVGALDDPSAVEASLDELQESTGTQLFAVFVDSFTGAQSGQDWADETAVRNGLGDDDVLLAVAVDDRNYAFSYPESFPLDEETTRGVERDVEQRLGADDWDGAVVTAADGFRAELGGGTGGTGASSVLGVVVPLLVGLLAFLLIVGVVVLIVVLVRRRRRVDPGAQGGRPVVTQAELDRRVAALLIQLDDSITSSDEEVGFATAQFGEETAAPFAAALAEARARTAEAFRLKQQLDDAERETPEERRLLSERIIELCESADAHLDEQADAFDALRDLERTAPAALAAVRADAAPLRERIDAAAGTVGELHSRYSPAAIETVVGNPAQAGELVAFAGTSADGADAALARGETGRAAVAVQAARSALVQADRLIDAVDALDGRLAEADASLAAVVDDTRQDLVAARALREGGSGRESVAEAVAEAERALEQHGPIDPVERLERIRQANAQLDRVVGAERDSRRRVEHARAVLGGTLTTARTQIATARDYIATRRGAVGDAPRTRLSEAARRLVEAESLEASDPVAALDSAAQASRLAQSAVAGARADVDAYRSPWRDDGRMSGGGGADLGGLLTGFLLGSLGDDDGGGRSYGGGGWFGGGSPGGWGGGSGGWSGGGRSGGFGGSSRSSSRRSSGGGFGGGRRSSGGGGRRSSGGRF